MLVIYITVLCPAALITNRSEEILSILRYCFCSKLILYKVVDRSVRWLGNTKETANFDDLLDGIDIKVLYRIVITMISYSCL